MIHNSGFFVAVLLTLLGGCATPQGVSYRQDVVPIIESKCVACHMPPAGAGFLQSRLSMESYDSLMEGSVYGPVIVPGDSRHSTLNMLVEGRIGITVRTPHPLTQNDIEILRLWVDQGAKNN